MDTIIEREIMKLHKVVGVFSFFLFFLLQSTFIFSAQQDENFVRGNHFFTTGRYALACDAYQNIENKGFAVLYNLGLSYMHQGNRSQAILWNKRAEKQANFKELTQLYDLYDCMHRQIDSDYEPSWYEQCVLFLKKCVLSISMLLLQILLLFIIIVLMLCWYRRLLVFNKAVFCMIFLYILLMSAWWYKTDMMQQRIGIVTKNTIFVFAGPDDSFYKKSELHESDEVMIVEIKPGYYKIHMQQVVGWIHDHDIELV